MLEKDHSVDKALLGALECFPSGGCALLNCEGGILHWSDRCFEATGIAASDIIGQSLESLFSPGDAITGKHREALKAVANSEPFETHTERRNEGGGQRKISISLAKLPQPIGEASFILFAEDETDFLEAQERLTQSELRFRTTFEQAAIGMALVTIDGKWLSVNRAMCAIVGYPRIQLLSSKAPILTHPDDRAIEQAEQNRCLVGEISSYQIEKRYVHSDGYVVWVLKTVTLVRSETGEPSYFISQIQDITARKNFVAALRDSEERFRLLSEHSTDLVARFSRDGRFEYASPSVTRMLGFRPDQLLGKSAYELVADEDINQVQQVHLHLLEATEPVSVCYRMRTASGGELWCEAQAVAVRDDETDEILHIVASIRDISQRKVLERKIDEQMIELNYQRTVVEAQKYELEAKQIELEAANLELERLAHIDGLTGVSNRRSFTEKLTSLWDADPAAPLSLILLDVDHFKKFNDSFGHQAGDEVLRKVGRVMLTRAGVAAFPARYGGEEFAVICTGTQPEDAEKLAETLRIALESESWEHRQVTGSFGISHRTTSMTKPSDLVEAADRALYAAKEAGRNRVEVAVMAMEDQAAA